MNRLLILYVFMLVVNVLFAQSKKELRTIIETQESRIDSLAHYIEFLQNDIEQLNSDVSGFRQDNDVLREELQNVRIDLKECKEGAKNLYTEAVVLGKNGNYHASKEAFKKVLERYPTSPEADLASKKIGFIDSIRAAKNDSILSIESTKNLKVNHDEFKERTFYSDQRGEKYQYDFDNWDAPKIKLNLYFSIPDNSKDAEALRLKVGYNDDNWLFIEKVIFLIDGRQFQLTGDFIRDSGGLGVFEWIDLPVGHSVQEILLAMMEANIVKVRFVGEKYHKDGQINFDQIQALKSIYNLYLEKDGKM